MNINILDFFNQKNFEILSEELNDADKRIHFEKILFNSFSAETAIDIDYVMQSRLISLLCTKVSQNSSHSEINKEEDQMIAALIIKAAPLADDRSQSFINKSLNKIATLVHHSAGMKLNFSQINFCLKNANLPATGEALLNRMLEDQDFNTLFEQAVQEDNVSLYQALIKKVPQKQEEIKNDLSHALELPVVHESLKIIKFLADLFPDECKAVLVVSLASQQTTLPWDNYNSIVELIYSIFPDVVSQHLFEKVVKNDDIVLYKDLLTMIPKKQEEIKNNTHTALKLPVISNSMKILRFLAEKFPNECTIALVTKDENGDTLTNIAASKNNINILKFFFSISLENFRESLSIRGTEGAIPLHYAARNDNKEMFNWIYELAPETINILTDNGNSVLSLVKACRLHHYRDMTELFKNRIELKQLYKTRRERKGVAHAFNFDGMTRMRSRNSQEVLGDLDLAGHMSEEWFHLMRKNLDRFDETYSDLYCKDFIPLIKHLFELGANYPTPYSNDDLLEMVQCGMPVLLNSGDTGHAVTILIWGDQFVICNRSSFSRSNIEVYHFDPKLLVSDHLKNIKDCTTLSLENYKNLFFKKLPKQLEFKQTELDVYLQNNALLQKQMVGNCSFVSPITAIFACLLLASVKGVTEGHLLQDLPSDTTAEEVSNRMTKAVKLYLLWLTNEQINFLDTIIKSFETGNDFFETDHVVIVEALRKAHLMPLDSFCEKRLQDLTQIYLNHLETEHRAQLKCHLAYWKTLGPVVNL